MRIVKKWISFVVLAAILSSAGFAQDASGNVGGEGSGDFTVVPESPAVTEQSPPDITEGESEKNAPAKAKHKYNPCDMTLGITGGAGFNMQGEPFDLEEGFFIADFYAGVNYDFYILNWLSVSTGLYAYEVLSLNLKSDFDKGHLFGIMFQENIKIYSKKK